VNAGHETRVVTIVILRLGNSSPIATMTVSQSTITTSNHTAVTLHHYLTNHSFIHSFIPMFRKPKRSAKAGLRKSQQKPEEEEEEEEEDTKQLTQELQEAKQSLSKRAKTTGGDNDNKGATSSTTTSLMHQYETSKQAAPTAAERATSTVQHHPTKIKDRQNPFLAGPIKAPTNIRTTSRFDYQPDICKDYKDTGFCGFGDTCIYLHDRGDTLSGWQIEQQWEQEQQQKRAAQEQQMNDFLSGGSKKAQEKDPISTEDGLPFACFLCRESFKDPVVTNCGHYFCEKCIMERVKTETSKCPVCSKDTHSVFHQPTKLLSKKRRLVGKDASWEDFHKAFVNNKNNTTGDDEKERDE
jgi:RING finger protein 113A